VLFLDVDGVLRPMGGFDWSGSAMVELQRIITTTKATIVLSSSWRLYSGSTERVRIELSKYSMSFTHCTPDQEGSGRVSEITSWVADWNANNDVKIIQWVAIDDADMAYDKRMKNHFVLTDGTVGITPENANNCIDLLLGKVPKEDSEEN